MAQTSKQKAVVKVIAESFSNAGSIDELDRTEIDKTVLVTMSFAPRNCKGRRRVNQFSVGPRGGLKVVKQEFTCND